MQAKQTKNVLFILAIIVLAVYFIVPQPQKLFSDLPWSQRLNLKPGIDMVGGTSLLYEIKPPPGGYHNNSQTLAEAVMESLKKRVDPQGVRNLIWRPQGNDRLEIQMPISPLSGKAEAARTAFADAQRQVEATNVRVNEVTQAVQMVKGNALSARLKDLAGGDSAREKLFTKLAAAYDAKQAAHARRDAGAEAEQTLKYDNLRDSIEATNLPVAQLQSTLDDPDKAQRQKELGDDKSQAAGFAARTKAIDHFQSTYADYNKLKNSIDDAAQLKQLLRGSGVLQFHILADDLPTSEFQAMVARLHKRGPRVEAGDTVQWFQVDEPGSFGYPETNWNGREYALCYIAPEKSMVNGPGTKPWALESAFPTQDSTGATAVGFRFDAAGATEFSDFTSNNLHKPLAAILDNKIVSAANINSRIGREGIITRSEGYNNTELSYLISTLNAGSLPAKLADEPISQHTVGPQLGSDNLKAGLAACGLGLVIVAVFLISYYYLAGVVAMFAVLMNVLLILAILAAFNATFTLPGVAGIVLSIGAAVDANVLIFERLREEQHHGLGIRLAMRNAYQHARSAIIDSNATTVITSIILVWLGTEEVKGFGLTLLIGLICSLFTSLFVTRTIFTILIDTFGIENFSSFPLTFPKWDRMLKPSIDWMKLAPIFVIFSTVIIATGITSFVVNWREGTLADVDFSSGTEVQFDLKKGMPIADLRKLIENANNPHLPAPSIVSVGKGDTTYEIVTPNVNSRQVRDAVLSELGTRVKVELPSKFDHVGQPVDQLIGKTIVPVEKLPLVINGFTVTGADNYLGGAAIVLDNLNPPLTADQIKARIDRQQMAPKASGESVFHDFKVVSPQGPDQKTSMAVILTADPTLAYDKDQAKWRENVVKPMWQLINLSLNRPAQLQKINNFDAQVAGDTEQDALMSLILSALVIMAYIWLRFGTLKYGTATVVAMLHDTAMVIGAVGLAHWAVEGAPWAAAALLIDPFRVNMTIVAAVLTVMSYSMIDTIVVFDRIRENRGKYGHLSRKIVNDSINQTLSRTLLTAGTTLVTVAGMYIVGGPGIHGFTFVLLVGILVGTYSSIAIASPILLIGRDVRHDEGQSSGSKRTDVKRITQKDSAVAVAKTGLT